MRPSPGPKQLALLKRSKFGKPTTNLILMVVGCTIQLTEVMRPSPKLGSPIIRCVVLYHFLNGPVRLFTSLRKPHISCFMTYDDQTAHTDRRTSRVSNPTSGSFAPYTCTI